GRRRLIGHRRGDERYGVGADQNFFGRLRRTRSERVGIRADGRARLRHNSLRSDRHPGRFLRRHAETDLARRRTVGALGQRAALFRFGTRRAPRQGRVDRRRQRRIDGGILPVLEDGLQPLARRPLSRLDARGAARDGIDRLPIGSALRHRLSRTFLSRTPDVESLYLDNFAVFSREQQLRLLTPEAKDRAGALDPYAQARRYLTQNDATTTLNR